MSYICLVLYIMGKYGRLVGANEIYLFWTF